MRPVIALVLLATSVAACAPAQRDDTVQPSPTTAAAPDATASPEPSSTLAPAASPKPDSPTASVETPAVIVAPAFPISPSLILQSVASNDDHEGRIRIGLERYLDALDRFRDSGGKDPSQLGAISGRFRDAVVAGIGASNDGVKRKFAVGSIHVDRVLVKPWGTRAVAEVTATIVDKAVDGSAPDQTETGRLRLVGDSPMVVDAWDASNGRWFNGPQTVVVDGVRRQTAEAIGVLLREESWVPGSAVESFGMHGDTPYATGHKAYLASLDRADTPSRTFANVTATIERYDTFRDTNGVSPVPDGLATVQIRATLLTTNAGGATLREPFVRRVVVLFGNWMPMVVDEQITPGVWVSGGDLALTVEDRNFA